ncbi:unnamed protein product [Prorocentrum cordatum]|uniref:Uncharacterized protein n=1 Tax=Prorocentrum cordatum TaxID=2364126 RepID=A0ABN9QPD7_9DINO|nr:unnamed protein product [Polarella glacialis]
MSPALSRDALKAKLRAKAKAAKGLQRGRNRMLDRIIFEADTMDDLGAENRYLKIQLVSDQMSPALSRDALKAKLRAKAKAAKGLQRGRNRMLDRIIFEADTMDDLGAENRYLKIQLVYIYIYIKLMRFNQENAKLQTAADKQAAKETELKKKRNAAESKVKSLLAAKAKGKGTKPQGPATVKGHAKGTQPKGAKRTETVSMAPKDPHELRRMMARISSPTLPKYSIAREQGSLIEADSGGTVHSVETNVGKRRGECLKYP